MRRTQSEETSPARSPGAFRADGSYDEEGWLGQRGAVDGLIRSMLKSRPNPTEAARLARNANCLAAFPNHAQWERQAAWYTCWSETSAEESVIRLGTPDGHWCSGRWVRGPEKDCDQRGHWRANRQDSDAIVAQIIAMLGGGADSGQLAAGGHSRGAGSTAAQ